MDYLFDVSTTTTRLEVMEGRIFHRATARLLLLQKRSSLDVHPEVELMTTRVKKTTEKDWEIMVRVSAYLKGMPEECLKLSMEDTKLIKLWVDGLYAVHEDMRIHTGEMM